MFSETAVHAWLGGRHVDGANVTRRAGVDYDAPQGSRNMLPSGRVLLRYARARCLPRLYRHAQDTAAVIRTPSTKTTLLRDIATARRGVNR